MPLATCQDVLSPNATSGAAPGQRLVSLDVMRGLTVAGMILVTDPGTYSAVFPPLLHAEWQGATATDMIFPAFLFMVGASTVFSIDSRVRRGERPMQLIAHILRRTIVLALLGLLVNGFPFYDLHHLRIPGILQRIALCYAVASFLYLSIRHSDSRSHISQRQLTRIVCILAGVIAAVLIGYWALLRFVPAPGFGPARYDSFGYLGAWMDRSIFGTRHLWPYGLTPNYGVTYDPEGLLSTLPAFANTLLGVLAGVWLRTSRSARAQAADLVLFGILLFASAWPLSSLMPINKRIWTSTFAVLSGGVSLLALGLLYWLIDVRANEGHPPLRWVRNSLAFVHILGSNAIAAFVLSSVITGSLDAVHLSIDGVPISVHHAGYQYLFASWLPPRTGSLAYALSIVALNVALLYPLYRRRIFLRV